MLIPTQITNCYQFLIKYALSLKLKPTHWTM